MKGAWGFVVGNWRFWVTPVVALVATAAIVANGLMHPHVVAGAAQANPVAVIQAAAENKAAAEAAAAEQKKRDDEANLRNLEQEVRLSMQDFFNDPSNMKYDRIIVRSVGLFAAGENVFEGMATMSANGGDDHDIPIHVRADDQKMQWSTDPGALRPLFR